MTDGEKSKVHSNKKELLAVLEKIRGISVLVVGDLILDRYIWGSVDRISPEAPVPVVLVKRTEDRLGGAGNVCRNLRRLGVKVGICGFIGDDPEGQQVLALLEADGVARDGVIADRARPTCLKTRVIAQRQQVVRVDREVPPAAASALQEGFAAVVDAHLDASDAVILSDYAKGVVEPPLMRVLQAACKSGRLSLGKRPLVVDPRTTSYDYGTVSIAKPNRKEAEAATGIKIVDRDTALQAARALLKKWNAGMMVITLGEDGLVIATAGSSEGIFRETVARQVFDVSGAGDTVTAVLTAAIAAGASPSVAGDLANIAAGIVVSEVGTVAVDPDKLRAEIEGLSK
jgi:D-beta-D-heptose 7-phosphate kinase/D-beta-D-heptose 1-phosphate adenosyltransferase